ncbi:MAG TPA: hypothetical protein VNK70_03370 [Candidatus Paceibacterota bacterium]|nr:hypothetical protein [Candidatus Paceibacterota bacterium]
MKRFHSLIIPHFFCKIKSPWHNNLVTKVKVRKVRKNSNPYKLLKTLGLATGVLIISTISPLGGAATVKSLIKGYMRKKRFEKHRFLSDLKNLQFRELIDYQEYPNNKVKITLTKRGEKAILQFNLDEMKIKKPARWDGKWRLIMFDIPHHQKQARDALRKKLKQLEFYPLQKSIYITPYPCEKEIEFIASLFNIRNNLLILYVSHFEGEEKLKYHFKI